MAALTLHAGSSVLPTPLAGLRQVFQRLWQHPAGLLDLFPPIVLAVPKSKVSHSRKSMRSANKGLKEKFNVVTCSSCGRAKRMHNICPYCYSEITRGFKTAARRAASSVLRIARRTPSPKSLPKPAKPIHDSGMPKPLSDLIQRRGGAVPYTAGQQLSKWMRARLGYKPTDPTVRAGKENRVVPSGKTRSTQHVEGEA